MSLNRRTRSGRIVDSGEGTPRSPSENQEAAQRRREERSATLLRLRQEEEDLNEQIEIQEREARIRTA